MHTYISQSKQKGLLFGFMATQPTPAQWKAAKACESFLLTYTGKKNKSTGIYIIDCDYIFANLTAFFQNGISKGAHFA